jgi:hypothetical protein
MNFGGGGMIPGYPMGGLIPYKDGGIFSNNTKITEKMKNLFSISSPVAIASSIMKKIYPNSIGGTFAPLKNSISYLNLLSNKRNQVGDIIDSDFRKAKVLKSKNPKTAYVKIKNLSTTSDKNIKDNKESTLRALSYLESQTGISFKLWNDISDEEKRNHLERNLRGPAIVIDFNSKRLKKETPGVAAGGVSLNDQKIVMPSQLKGLDILTGSSSGAEQVIAHEIIHSLSYGTNLGDKYATQGKGASGRLGNHSKNPFNIMNPGMFFGPFGSWMDYPTVETIREKFGYYDYKRLPGNAMGGYIKGYGMGGPTDDSILARISNGEYVMSAKTVKKMGVGFMDKLNAGSLDLPGYAMGGPVNYGKGGYAKYANGGSASNSTATYNYSPNITINGTNLTESDIKDIIMDTQKEFVRKVGRWNK